MFMKKVFQIAVVARTMQGKFLLEEQGKTYYPKLFLITQEYYEKMQKSHAMDYSELFRLIPDDISFQTFIQGTLKECKYGFVIRIIDPSTIRVTLLDRVCACFSFDLIKNGEHSYRLVPYFSCTLRDGRKCPNYKGKNLSCISTLEECPTRKISVVHTVLLCLQEYLIKKKSQPMKMKNSKKKNSSESTEKFQVEGMVSICDFYSEEKYEPADRKKHHSSSGYGVKKRPHVRRGHERNLANGDTVHVRSTIIHKETFAGYETGERMQK